MEGLWKKMVQSKTLSHTLYHISFSCFNAFIAYIYWSHTNQNGKKHIGCSSTEHYGIKNIILTYYSIYELQGLAYFNVKFQHIYHLQNNI